MTDLVAWDLDARGIVWIRLEDEARQNRLSRPLVAELHAALARTGSTPEARVCVIEGLPEIFCSGGDLEVLRALAQGELEPYDLLLTRALLDVPVPTLAAMAGPAVGGGLVLGLAADLVVLAQESRYGCNFTDLGFTPGMGATGLLGRALGEPIAAEMLFTGAFLRGAELAGRTHVNAIVPRDQVHARALALATRIADKPRHVLVLLKQALVAPKRRAFEGARVAESLMHDACFARPETRALVEDGYWEAVGDRGGAGC